MRYKIGVVACVLLGFILLLSGFGKLFMGLPAQLDFVENLSPIFGISEMEAGMLVYVLPWVEILAGLLLVLQLFPSIVAIFLCVPLSIGFAISNIWMLINDTDFEHCNSCFGIFERYFGSLTPIQALGIDVLLFALILVIVFVCPRYKLLWGLFK